MRGRITLGSLGHFDSYVADVAEYGFEHISDVDRTFGDSEFEFNGHTDCYDGIVERQERNVFLGVVLILTVEYVLRNELVVAEFEVESAEFESEVDCAYVEVETDVELFDIGVRVVDAEIFSLVVLNVTVQPYVTGVFNLSVLVEVLDEVRLVRFDGSCDFVISAFSVVGVQHVVIRTQIETLFGFGIGKFDVIALDAVF